MELKLTEEQLQELTQNQMDRLQHWWAKKHDGEPLLTATDMIDLLGSIGVGVSLVVPREERPPDGKVVIPTDDRDLFFGVWGVLKESL